MPESEHLLNSTSEWYCIALETLYHCSEELLRHKLGESDWVTCTFGRQGKECELRTTIPLSKGMNRIKVGEKPRTGFHKALV